MDIRFFIGYVDQPPRMVNKPLPKIYIAGPMRGYRYFNFPAFDAAVVQLSLDGWDPVSPADIDRDHGLTNDVLLDLDDIDGFEWDTIPPEFDCGCGSIEDMLLRDVTSILKECDAMAVLPGWERSRGATAEVALALAIGMPIYDPLTGEPYDPYANGKDETDANFPLPGSGPPTFTLNGVTVAVPDAKEDSTNPKDRIGVKKPPLNLIPPVALLHEAMAMKNGADKYGAFNWREKKVQASIYIAAAMRHLMQWQDGEENATDSGNHHLGHARACLGILLDAQESGNLIDDRPTPGPASDVISRLTIKD